MRQRQTSCVLQGAHTCSRERLIGSIQTWLWRNKHDDPIAPAREQHPVALQPHLMGVMGFRPGLLQALPAIRSPQKIIPLADDRKIKFQTLAGTLRGHLLELTAGGGRMGWVRIPRPLTIVLGNVVLLVNVVGRQPIPSLTRPSVAPDVAVTRSEEHTSE